MSSKLLKQGAFKLKKNGEAGATSLSKPPTSTSPSKQNPKQTKVAPLKPPKGIVRSDTFKKKSAAKSLAAFAGKPAKTPAKKKKKRRRASAFARCKRRCDRRKKDCREHGKQRCKILMICLMWLSSLLGVFAYFSSLSGCSIADKLVVTETETGFGDGYLSCPGRYGGYYVCVDKGEWNCHRRFELCNPHSWAIGMYKDPTCIEYDDSVLQPRIAARRDSAPSEQVYASNFTFKGGETMEFVNNIWLPQLGAVPEKAYPDSLLVGLSKNDAGLAQEVPPAFLKHDYFFGTYIFGLNEMGTNEAPNKFFEMSILECKQLTFTVDEGGEEVEKRLYAMIEPWCEEGEVIPGVHKRDVPPSDLYIKVPKRSANELAI